MGFVLGTLDGMMDVEAGEEGSSRWDGGREGSKRDGCGSLGSDVVDGVGSVVDWRCIQPWSSGIAV